MAHRYFILASSAALLVAIQTLPAADDTLDWLIEKHATTAPTTLPAPATAPAGRKNPLVRQTTAAETLTGTITLNTGGKLTGTIATTPGKPLRIWVEEKHEYADVELAEIASMTANVIWERDEKEWHFIASGSDIKEYTGKTYPARETTYTIALTDGRQITGGVVAPLYIHSGEGDQMLVLNKRNKGPVGAKLEDLVYVKKLEISAQSTP